MKILVTGATGFIGHHLVPWLLERGHELTIVVRNESRARQFSWFNRVRCHEWDLSVAIDSPFERFGQPDGVIHLAWPGLPNYKERFHIEENFPAARAFLESMVNGGLGRVLVTGTCAEYGMQGGCLSEATPAQPVHSYAQAKDLLRMALEDLQRRHDFTLQWARLFYVHGEGQNPNSLLAQLDRAIDSGATVFRMSGGAQLRDYLPVEEVAHRLANLFDHPNCSGIVNICSGQLISIEDLVRRHLAKRESSIQLALGCYPYPDYEPMAFCGDGTKYLQYCAGGCQAR